MIWLSFGVIRECCGTREGRDSLLRRIDGINMVVEKTKLMISQSSEPWTIKFTKVVQLSIRRLLRVLICKDANIYLTHS
jgi:hypothetical protein